MFRWLKRIALIFTVFVLLLTNVLSLTSVAFNTAISGALATATGITTIAQKVKLRRANAKKIGKQITRRTVKTASKSMALVPGEMVPYVGVAVALTAISIEIYAACENLNDMSRLYAAIGIEDAETGTFEQTCQSMRDQIESLKAGFSSEETDIGTPNAQ